MDVQSIIHVTAYAPNGKEEHPYCSLLEIDQCKLLLDAGAFLYSSSYNTDHLEPLKAIAKDIDGILITHATFAMIGGLPYLYGKLGFQCPIFMTVACQSMTQVSLLSALHSYIATDLETDSVQDKFNLAFVSHVMKKVVGLRYSQPFHLSGKAAGVSLIAGLAGHSLGGAFWKIKKDEEDIVYSSRVNFRTERHLDPTDLASIIRPSVLIADASSILAAPVKRKLRDKEFKDIIVSCLRKSGSVLIPVEATGRSLEILLLLNSIWNEFKYPYPIYFLGSEAQAFLDYVKSMLEWMSKSISNSFTSNRENPFDMKHIQIVPNLGALESLNRVSSVIITTDISLEFGLSSRILYEFANQPSNMIFMPTFLERPGTLAQRIMQYYQSKSRGDFEFSFKLLVPLEQEEISHFEEINATKDIKDFLGTSAMSSLIEDVEVPDYEGEESTLVETDPQLKSITTDSGYSAWQQKLEYDFRLKKILPLTRTNFPKNFRPKIAPSIFFPTSTVSFSDTLYGFSLDQNEWPNFEFEDKMDIDTNDAMMPEGSVAVSIPSGLQEALISLEGQAKRVPTLETAQRPLMKPVFWTFKGALQCQYRTLNFDGIVDGATFRDILNDIQPQKLLFVQGTRQALEYFAQHLKVPQMLSISQSQTVDLSFVSNVVQVRLSEALMETLDFVKYQDYELAHLTGLLLHLDIPSIQPHVTHESQRLFETVQSVIDLDPSTLLQRPVMLGDMKLVQLKKKLQAEGLQVDLQSGRLLVNQKIVIYKNAMGEISMEGTTCREYYIVREHLYQSIVTLV